MRRVNRIPKFLTHRTTGRQAISAAQHSNISCAGLSSTFSAFANLLLQLAKLLILRRHRRRLRFTSCRVLNMSAQPLKVDDIECGDQHNIQEICILVKFPSHQDFPNLKENNHNWNKGKKATNEDHPTQNNRLLYKVESRCAAILRIHVINAADGEKEAHHTFNRIPEVEAANRRNKNRKTNHDV